MSFAEGQTQLLAGKLLERHVRTREQRGVTLSYIEGWHAIAEANRIFGFDAWDRETVWSDCVWQDARGETKACAYAARVRVRVRAGDTMVCRDGSGVGHGTGATLGEAHESALKEAETDAMKRALMTFGNLFGLALYDKEQAGVRRSAKRNGNGNGNGAHLPWVLLGASGEPLSTHETPHGLCIALKEAIHAATDQAALKDLWERNSGTLQFLRAGLPDLKTAKGTHYAEVLVKHYERKLLRLQEAKAEPSPDAGPAIPTPQPAEPATEPQAPEAIDKSALTLAEPKRIRDEDHLRFVASQPCLVCGRTPAHAHHLRFAQPRSMSSKVSDEWTVPLCLIHHRALHDAGSEEAWWAERKIDAKAEAARLWLEQSHPRRRTSLFSSNIPEA